MDLKDKIIKLFKIKFDDKIKKQIRYKAIVIKLYNYKIEDSATHKSNIKAFDSTDNLLWIAENCPCGHYYDMQIDEENDLLEANDGSVMFYEIDINTGKIIREEMRK